MPRDMSGVYTIPAGSLNPAVTGTAISSSDWNDFILDLEQAITESMVVGNQVFTGQTSFDPGSDALPGIIFTGDPDTGFFHPAANQIGITVNGGNTSVIAVFEETKATIDGDLVVTGDTNVQGNLDVDVDANVDGTLTVDGTSTFTGRITASAGVAGILVTDLPSRVFIDESAPAPTAITGDTDWHELTPVSDALTLSAVNRVMLNVGPMPAQAGPVYATGNIDGNGAPAQALFRIARTIGPAFSVWTDVGAIEAWETSSANEGIPNFCFSVIDFPGVAGDYKYRVEGAVGAAAANMEVFAIRLTGLVV